MVYWYDAQNPSEKRRAFNQKKAPQKESHRGFAGECAFDQPRNYILHQFRGTKVQGSAGLITWEFHHVLLDASLELVYPLEGIPYLVLDDLARPLAPHSPGAVHENLLSLELFLGLLLAEPLLEVCAFSHLRIDVPAHPMRQCHRLSSRTLWVILSHGVLGYGCDVHGFQGIFTLKSPQRV